jgi:hypothetical protein
LLKIPKNRKKTAKVINIGPKINDDMDKNFENFVLEIFFIISINFLS